MPYRVIKDDDVIESTDEIEIKGGVLMTIQPKNGQIETAYAPGHWDVVYWEEKE